MNAPSSNLAKTFMEKPFDLICLDFDGLLVDTEHLHYTSYLNTISSMGVDLSHIDFATYCHLSHAKGGSDFYSAILKKSPSFPYTWEEVRIKKRLLYTDEVRQGKVPLMPGVEILFSFLEEQKIPSCVVTNSLANDTDIIRSHLPILNEIPLWITKDLYAKGKPHPDGYLKALTHFPKIDPSRVIGLDDTLKGVEAMRKAGIFPILVCSDAHPHAKSDNAVTYFPTLLDFAKTLSVYQKKSIKIF